MSKDASQKTELNCEIRFKKYWKLSERVAKNRDIWRISNIYQFRGFLLPILSIFIIYLKRISQVSSAFKDASFDISHDYIRIKFFDFTTGIAELWQSNYEV